MTKLSAVACATVTLAAGFGLGLQAGSAQEAPPVAVERVDHISVFVRSVEEAAEWHRKLLGTQVPAFSVPPRPLVFPADRKWDPASKPRYGHIALQNARIELQEPVGGDSRWREFLAKNGQGIEHLGFAVPDVKAALARFQQAGGILLMGGCEGCTAHVDMRDTLGYIVELQPLPRR